MMRYYLIVGEASGDLHASRLMKALQKCDVEADFRFFGGDNMAAVGGTRVKHYKELAYMGFIPVLLHLTTIFRNMKMCKRDIVKWQPDVVILVDYPGFNLSIAKFLTKVNRLVGRKTTRWDYLTGISMTTRHLVSKLKKQIPVYYYISPKIWAWKEWRIRSIKRDVKEMFSILPFEKNFYEVKHHYKIHYVGNPTAEDVLNFQSSYKETFGDYISANGLQEKPIIALLAGSRKQEIKDNLPTMIEAAKHFENYQMVLAGAPSIEESYYKKFIKGTKVRLVKNRTYELLSHATAALVTSGTATLETALFNVPQVVCYETPFPKLIRFAFNHIIKVQYISLVNLIVDKEVVQELLADRFTVYNIANELYNILPGTPRREEMLADYREVRRCLGDEVAPDNAARIIIDLLNSSFSATDKRSSFSNETPYTLNEIVSSRDYPHDFSSEDLLS